MRHTLQALAGRDGIVAGLAFDHRDSLDVLLDARGLGGLDLAWRRALKATVVHAVAPAATTVMLDHEYGATALAFGAIPAGVALVMPLEAQGYAQLGDERDTSLLPDFGPPDALALGAAACKILVPLRPDRPEHVKRQVAVARHAAELAHASGLPLMLEPQVYRLSDEDPEAFARRYTGLVVDAVRAAAHAGADLLKLPFPAAAEPDEADADVRARAACEAMDDAAAGLPWILYGAGVPARVFAWQLRHAGAAGACGFLVGRTVWMDALVEDPAQVAEIAAVVCRPRFEVIAAVAREACRPLVARG